MINKNGVGKNVRAYTFTGARAPGATPLPLATVPQPQTRIRRRPVVTGLLCGLFSGLAFGLVCSLVPDAAQAYTGDAASNPVSLASLPREAQQTEARIFSGGPFPFSQDGVVFANREHHLDSHVRGYYHEYTVPTPGARTRGARRIVCGGVKLTEPDACFYTEDHYNSFHRIVK